MVIQFDNGMSINTAVDYIEIHCPQQAALRLSEAQWRDLSKFIFSQNIAELIAGGVRR